MKTFVSKDTVQISIRKGETAKSVHLTDRISIEVDARDQVIAVIIKDTNSRPTDLYK